MKKLVLTLKDHPELTALYDQSTVDCERYAARHAWLKKQEEALLEEMKANRTGIWAQIEAYLSAKKLYPEGYTKDKHLLEWDADLGLLLMLDKPDENSSLASLLKLLGK